jgi:hypothetical protein
MRAGRPDLHDRYASSWRIIASQTGVWAEQSLRRLSRSGGRSHQGRSLLFRETGTRRCRSIGHSPGAIEFGRSLLHEIHSTALSIA